MNGGKWFVVRLDAFCIYDFRGAVRLAWDNTWDGLNVWLKWKWKWKWAGWRMVKNAIEWN